MPLDSVKRFLSLSSFLSLFQLTHECASELPQQRREQERDQVKRATQRRVQSCHRVLETSQPAGALVLSVKETLG